jgi:hypothetical protein
MTQYTVTEYHQKAFAPGASENSAAIDATALSSVATYCLRLN